MLACVDAVVQFTLRLNTYFVVLVLFLVLRCVVLCRVVLRLMSGVHVVVSDLTYSTAHVIGISDLEPWPTRYWRNSRGAQWFVGIHIWYCTNLPGMSFG